MKKKFSPLIPLALILFLLPGFVLAYGGKGHDQRDPERMADRLEKHLDLNATQKEALKPLLSEMMEKRQALMEDFHQKAKAAMEALDAEEETKLQGLLNEDQMEAFRKLREERREKIMDRHPGRGKGHPGLRSQGS
ncbi:hypothetical protein [Desulfobotulus sp.]|jgi:hypothetical protein|uniref:Spy/CpxP family protein refolding chaperone n=1 Tax=Desulfobotulus sp. TaxID=1940337 RepID=UPI002A3709ED|nr:hypothetical protein [Desulfobotulus sp.]MDY0162072.1 hypothetical protein [Desulfobotulus sp.]